MPGGQIIFVELAYSLIQIFLRKIEREEHVGRHQERRAGFVVHSFVRRTFPGGPSEPSPTLGRCVRGSPRQAWAAASCPAPSAPFADRKPCGRCPGSNDASTHRPSVHRRSATVCFTVPLAPTLIRPPPPARIIGSHGEDGTTACPFSRPSAQEERVQCFSPKPSAACPPSAARPS